MIRPPDYVAAIKPYVPGKPVEELERELSAVRAAAKLKLPQAPPTWRLISSHAEGQRHVVPITQRRPPVVEAPRLVLVPRIDFPFLGVGCVVVEVVVVEEPIPILDGRMALGGWQSIFFVELDGPREQRRVLFQSIGAS